MSYGSAGEGLEISPYASMKELLESRGREHVNHSTENLGAIFSEVDGFGEAMMALLNKNKDGVNLVEHVLLSSVSISYLHAAFWGEFNGIACIDDALEGRVTVCETIMRRRVEKFGDATPTPMILLEECYDSMRETFETLLGRYSLVFVAKLPEFGDIFTFYENNFRELLEILESSDDDHIGRLCSAGTRATPFCIYDTKLMDMVVGRYCLFNDNVKKEADKIKDFSSQLGSIDRDLRSCSGEAAREATLRGEKEKIEEGIAECKKNIGSIIGGSDPAAHGEHFDGSFCKSLQNEFGSLFTKMVESNFILPRTYAYPWLVRKLTRCLLAFIECVRKCKESSTLEEKIELVRGFKEFALSNDRLDNLALYRDRLKEKISDAIAGGEGATEPSN